MSINELIENLSNVKERYNMENKTEYKIGDAVRVWLKPAFSRPVAEGAIMSIGLDGTVLIKTGPTHDDWFRTTLTSLEKIDNINYVQKYGPNPNNWIDE